MPSRSERCRPGGGHSEDFHRVRVGVSVAITPNLALESKSLDFWYPPARSGRHHVDGARPPEAEYWLAQ